MHNWFQNNGRSDRFPQKVPITDDDVDEDGNAIPKRRSRARGNTHSKKQLMDLFGTKKRKTISYDIYRNMQWDQGLKERVDANWAMFQTSLEEGTDLSVARAEFAERFAAMELANQSLEVKKHLLDACGNVKSETGIEGIPPEERERIQMLIDYAEYVLIVSDMLFVDTTDQSKQQQLVTTLQTTVDALHSQTGMSYFVIGGGCDVKKNGGLIQYA